MSATPVTQPTAAVRIPRELWVLVAAAFVIALGFGLILPVLPQFAQSFGVGATASSIVVSAFAFFRLLFAPAGGRLIARFGERPIYLAGLVIVAISTGATAFAHTYWQLLLYRGLGGIGSVMFTVSAVALIVRLAPPAIRARISSVYASAFLFGGILGPVVGGLLGNLGLRVPFLVYAVALLVAASLVAIFISGSALRPAEGAPVLPVLAVRDGVARRRLPRLDRVGLRQRVGQLRRAQRDPAAVRRGRHRQGAVGRGHRAGRLRRRQRRSASPCRGGCPTGSGGGRSSSAAWSSAAWRRSSPGSRPTCRCSSRCRSSPGVGAGMLNPAQQAALADIVGRERNGGPALATFQMSADSGAIVGPDPGRPAHRPRQLPAGLRHHRPDHPARRRAVAVRPRDPRRAARGAHPGCAGGRADIEATIAERSREA